MEEKQHSDAGNESVYYNIEKYNFINKIKLSIYSMSTSKIFYILMLIVIIMICLISISIKYSQKYTSEIPSTGGIYKEASVNNIRYLDPIFSNNETEQSICKLIYSGLLRREGEKYVPDLAESISQSPDGLTYTILIKKAKFSDNSELTSSDVIYTIDLIQDSLINSPYHRVWKNITANAVDDHTVSIKVKAPISNINEILTQGIIKKNEWIKLPRDSLSLSDLNINAIGAGPYKINKVIENNKIITNVNLIINNNYYSVGKLPYIKNVEYQVFANNNEVYTAIKNGKAYTAIGIDPNEVKALLNSNKNIKINTAKMYRTYSLFFNSNNDKGLSDINYRRDLRDSIDRDYILNNVLSGFGSKASNVYTHNYDMIDNSVPKTLPHIYNDKVINIVTINNAELIKVANTIKSNWAKIGVNADIHTYEVGEFQQDIIKNRNYSVLLFAVDTYDENDIYNLWHSSGRNYPGSNITNYYSTNLDKNLETLLSFASNNDTNINNNTDIKNKTYKDIETELDSNVAWIPLYNPYILSTLNTDVHLHIDDHVYTSSQLLDYIRDAYINTETVYNFFLNDNFYKKISDFIH